MSGIQKIILITGIMIVALSILVPPWVYTFQRDGYITGSNPAGYYSIFYPPHAKSTSLEFGVKMIILALSYRL